MPVELGRIIVEERPDIAVGDRLPGRERAEPGEIEPHAEHVLRFERQRLAQGRHRLVPQSQLGSGTAEHRMGGREAGGQLDHLPGEIGGSLEIALLEGGSGIFIATVGAKIAG